MQLSVSVALLSVIVCHVCFQRHAHAKLKQLNVLFRHGDRYPVKIELDLWGNGQSNNRTFIPGALTNVGKLRMFRLGQYLRREYNDFLGDMYYPENVKARSTSSDRTRMSIQLVLASLYPPKDPQKWNPNLNWQPIPYDYLPTLDDEMLTPFECPKSLKVRDEIESSPEFKRKKDSFNKLIDLIKSKLGPKVNIHDTFDLYVMYHNLVATQSIGIEPPTWLENIFPYGKLHDAALLEYELETYNDKAKRLNGGPLLRQILENMKNTKSQLKINLYSAHEMNIAIFWQTLGLYKTHVPRYSSAAIIELHEVNNQYFIKFKHYKGVVMDEESIIEQLFVPGCRTQCPLEKFVKITHKIIPTDDDLVCDKRSLRDELLAHASELTGMKKVLLGEILAEKIR